VLCAVQRRKAVHGPTHSGFIGVRIERMDGGIVMHKLPQLVGF